jgi:hypothetical protein
MQQNRRQKIKIKRDNISFKLIFRARKLHTFSIRSPQQYAGDKNFSVLDNS